MIITNIYKTILLVYTIYHVGLIYVIYKIYRIHNYTNLEMFYAMFSIMIYIGNNSAIWYYQ